MNQQPPGFGWYAQPSPGFRPLGQANIPPPQFTGPFGPPNTGPIPPPAMGCPDPNQFPPPMPYYGPPVAAPGGAPIGFDLFTNPPPQPSAPQPSAPQPSVPLTYAPNIPKESISLDSDHTTSTGAKVLVITTERDKKPHGPPPHRPQNSPREQRKTPTDTGRRPSASTGDHRNTTRYQKGLEDMADLMNDVDLTDEVLDTVKSRFGLK